MSCAPAAPLLLRQATMQTPPSALTSMMRGLLAAYSVVMVAYFPVAGAGYAAFGNTVSPDVLLSVSDPAWLVRAANFMVVVHLAASYQARDRPLLLAALGPPVLASGHAVRYPHFCCKAWAQAVAMSCSSVWNDACFLGAHSCLLRTGWVSFGESLQTAACCVLLIWATAAAGVCAAHL